MTDLSEAAENHLNEWINPLGWMERVKPGFELHAVQNELMTAGMMYEESHGDLTIVRLNPALALKLEEELAAELAAADEQSYGEMIWSDIETGGFKPENGG